MPGGSGTFEELMKALTWKKLALYTNQIVILNTSRYFDSFRALKEQAGSERFMYPDHHGMWAMVDISLKLITTLLDFPEWNMDRMKLAVQK